MVNCVCQSKRRKYWKTWGKLFPIQQVPVFHPSNDKIRKLHRKYIAIKWAEMFWKNVLISIINCIKESPILGRWIKNCSGINNFICNTVRFHIENEKAAWKTAQSQNKENQKICSKKWLKKSINQFSNKLKYMRKYIFTITVRRNKFHHIPPCNMWGEKVNWVM